MNIKVAAFTVSEKSSNTWSQEKAKVTLDICSSDQNLRCLHEESLGL